MRKPGLAFGTCLIAAAGLAFAGEAPDVRHMDDGVQAGRPWRFVVPDYPKDALDKGVTGYVDVDGKVSPLREFSDVQYHAGSPEAEVFVPALKEVTKHWMLYPLYRNGCFPSNQRAGIRVWFAIAGGKPKIDITVSAEGTRKDPFPAQSCGKPWYPRGALREGQTALVYARVPINPDGSTGKVTAESYPRRGAVDSSFEEAVDHAFSGCRFAPVPQDDPPRVACYEVFFKLER